MVGACRNSGFPFHVGMCRVMNGIVYSLSYHASGEFYTWPVLEAGTLGDKAAKSGATILSELESGCFAM